MKNLRVTTKLGDVVLIRDLREWSYHDNLLRVVNRFGRRDYFVAPARFEERP